MFEYADQMEEKQAKLVVIGIGGAGGNAIDTMISSRLKGVDFLAVNTDAQALRNCKAQNKVQLGNGLGAGSVPEVGRDCTAENIEEVAGAIEGADMVFLTAGMGGGTGTGGAPVIAEKAREMGILTVGVVTKPFPFEARKRARIAENGIQEFKDHVDSLIVIPNQRLMSVAGKNMTFKDAFKMADNVLLHAVQGISDLVTKPGLINVDFADVKTIMQERGMALMGIGSGTGDERAANAAQGAISSPLLEDVTIDGARGVLINITGPEDMTMAEVTEACELIYDHTDDEALIIFGTSFDEDAQDEVKITVVATGFQNFDSKPRGVRRLNEDLDVPTHLRENNRRQNPASASVPRAAAGSKPLRPVAPFNEDEDNELQVPAFIRKRMN